MDHHDLWDPARADVDARIDDEGVRWITFSREDQRNALTVGDLRAAHALVLQSPAPAAVVFTGAGNRAFSAGMHLRCFDGLTRETARELIVAVRDLLAAVRTLPVPTVSAVRGYCLGAAFELALVCDLRVASDDAGFGLPEVKVGVPSVLDAALLQQHIGLSKAKELLLTGDIYSAAEMERFGLLNAVVPGDQVIATTRRLLKRITVHTTDAIAAQKRLFDTWQHSFLTDGAAISVEEFARSFAPGADDHP